MTELAELITRLEKATGPDRELDIAVALAAGYRVPNADKLEKWMIESNLRSCARSYTESLDAARSLILPCHNFGALSQVSPTDWLMLIFSRTDSRARWEGEASTAELALCIAALKARQSSPES